MPRLPRATDEYPNLTVKKIPKAVLTAASGASDDYSHPEFHTLHLAATAPTPRARRICTDDIRVTA